MVHENPYNGIESNAKTLCGGMPGCSNLGRRNSLLVMDVNLLVF